MCAVKEHTLHLYYIYIYTYTYMYMKYAKKLANYISNMLVARCMAVDREIACILLMCIQFCDLLVSFDCLRTSFCSPWATLGFLVNAFWAPWSPLGVSWASLWHPFTSFLLRVAICGTLGSRDDFGSKMDVQFRANGSQVARLRTKRKLAELRRGRRGSAQWAQSAA